MRQALASCAQDQVLAFLVGCVVLALCFGALSWAADRTPRDPSRCQLCDAPTHADDVLPEPIRRLPRATVVLCTDCAQVAATIVTPRRTRQ